MPIHVTLGTFRSRPWFADGRVARLVFAIFARHRSTLAICLMPDHAHWLVDGTPGWQREVRRVKSFTARVAWRAGHPGRLWQRSFWDRAVRGEEDLAGVAHDLIANPVRRGLVARVEDYPYQYCRWHSCR